MGYQLNYPLYEELVRRVIAEGCVLLRNENKALPLSEGMRVALYGRAQFHEYKSGTGSGGLVNAPKRVRILDALQSEQGIFLDEGLEQVYAKWSEENPYVEGVGWGQERWSQDEMPLDAELAQEVAKRTDAAIVIIGRSAGEDRDNKVVEGSYLLTEAELSILKTVCAAHERVILLLNTGNVIDMSFLEECKPQAVMYVWQGGMISGLGVVDLLVGRESPSGRLVDTIAYQVEDYPSDCNFGDLVRDIYAEDIYVGYRYFETVAKDKVQFPFGYGLSYTAFSIEPGQAAFDGEFCFLSATVTNIGDVPGKCAVQAYMQAPQGQLGKPLRTLVGFEKTETLEPGQSESLIFAIDKRELSSYDDSGKSGYPECFVMEKGVYYMYLGENVRDAVEVYSFTLQETLPVEQKEAAMRPIVPFKRMKPDLRGGEYVMGTEETPLREEEPTYMMPKALDFTGDKGYKLADVLSGKITMDHFLAQLTEEEMFGLIRGEGMGSPKATPGTASTFGGVSESLKAYGIPCGCCSDGPSGLRLDCGTKAFSLPNGTLIACTMNRSLVSDLFEQFGMEARLNHVDTVLGPGMNLHRHPLNGRNFEYFSEDPYVTGQMAAAELEGFARAGVTGTLKHFCGNNQETNRYSLDSVVSERALREIYLRGFEIAIREGGAYLVMTTYGRVNGMWTSTDPELNTGILREQWYFEGMVMTDWWAAINEQDRYDEAGSRGSHTNFAAMVNAQNDVYMCCPDGSKNDHGDNLREALDAGILTRDALVRSAANVCGALLRTPAMLRMCGAPDDVEVIGRTAEWELEINEEVPYFKVEDEITIDLSDVTTKRGSIYAFGWELTKPGGYELELTAIGEGTEAAQLPITMYASGIPVSVFLFHGTNGREVTQTKKIYFNANYAVQRFFFTKTGLTLKSMRLRYISDLDTAMRSGDYVHG